MIRTGDEYRESIRDGREVWIDGERVPDVTDAPDVQAAGRRPRAHLRHGPRGRHPRRHDLRRRRHRRAQRGRAQAAASSRRTGRPSAARSTAVLDDLGGVVIRVGDETIGEMWSLYDGQDVLNEVDPRFSENITRAHPRRAARPTRSTSPPTPIPRATAPSGRRTRTRTCCCTSSRETDAGIVVRGAKYETAAAYANQAFVKPTIANWGDAELSDYALGFICDMGTPRCPAHLPHRLRRPRAGRRLPAVQPVRRGGHAGGVRRRGDPLGERAVLPPHAGRHLHPRDAAPLQRLPVRAADPAHSPTC